VGATVEAPAGFGGFEALRRLFAVADGYEAGFRQAGFLRAGARGYVLKESAESELIAAIRAVASGRSFFSPKVRRLLQQEHVERIRRAGGEDS
jgi:DNA-binding NarL/FixJ family response regulator